MPCAHRCAADSADARASWTDEARRAAVGSAGPFAYAVAAYAGALAYADALAYAEKAQPRASGARAMDGCDMGGCAMDGCAMGGCDMGGCDMGGCAMAGSD